MIISILDTIVSSLKSGSDTFTFNYGPEDWRNLDTDEAPFTPNHGVIFLDQPTPLDFNIAQSGFIGEAYPVNLLFMYQSQFDYTPTQHDSICIDPARLAIRQFISACQASELIDSIEGNGEALQFTNLLDVNVSGISIPLIITPSINASVCIQT